MRNEMTPRMNDIPKRPWTEPTIEDGWVNKHGTFMRVRPAQAMSDEYLALAEIVPAKRYVWPPVDVVVRVKAEEKANEDGNHSPN